MSKEEFIERWSPDGENGNIIEELTGKMEKDLDELLEKYAQSKPVSDEERREEIEQAHMAGQINEQCKDPSYSIARGYYDSLPNPTVKPVIDKDEKYHSHVFQWLYNYTSKQNHSDEKTAIIKALKDLGCV